MPYIIETSHKRKQLRMSNAKAPSGSDAWAGKVHMCTPRQAQSTLVFHSLPNARRVWKWWKSWNLDMARDMRPVFRQIKL